MSEFEKKDVNEMDAAEMLAGYQEKTASQERPQTTEHWAVELIREFDENAKRWHRRQGWGALGLACFHGLNVMACCAALLGNYWQLVLVGLAAANLLMVGGWMSKAKTGWEC